MSLLNRLEVFDPEVHLWSRYVKRLKHFLLASKVEKELILPTIITLLGDKTYAILCDLFASEDPVSKTTEEVICKLSKHFSLKYLTPVERNHFSKRKQRKEESIADFVLALSNLSKNCKHGASLEDLLCEQFAYGLFSSEIRTRLLFEETLPLDLAIKLASSIEVAKKGASTFDFSPDDPGSVRRIKQSRPVHPHSARPAFVNNPCNRCGDTGHDAASCRFKDYMCNFCKKVGHLAKVCKSKGKRTKPLTTTRIQNVEGHCESQPHVSHVIDDHSNRAETSEGDINEYNFFRAEIKNLKHSNDNPIMLEFLVNKQSINFELDTGAGVTLIPENLYKQKLSSCKLLPTPIILNTISEQIKPLGKILVSANYNGNIVGPLEIFVIQKLSVPLLGRAWIYKFDILNGLFKTVVHKSILPISVQNPTIKLENILRKYDELFSSTLGELKNFEAHLTLHKDATPRFFKYRPIPFALRSAVELELQKLQSQGILIPIQHSNWAAPIVPILKKDNSLRICGDYKVGLNPALVNDCYPLPRIDDIFAQLNDGVVFSKLDMTQAYQQLCMDEESQLLLTINTHKGLFKVKRMPFGISPAPSIFQRAMDQILAGIDGVVCYLDDILITGKSINEHLSNLDRVLSRLVASGVTLNKLKCEFLKPQVEYLGHIIDAQGLHTTNSKISAIQEAPQPRDVPQLRSFLGLVSYYRKFLPNLASTLAPLNKLLQKETKWIWDSTANEAFKKVKEAITSPRVLVYLNPRLPISLACDASPTGLGAVISHIYPDGTDRPIAFASRSLSSAERNYSQLDKEALAIIFGVKKFHQYLFGRKFLLLTDHKPLTRIFAPNAEIPTLAAARLQRWALILAAYDYEIKFRGSSSHQNADALSRSPSCSINFISQEEEPVDIFLLNQLETLPITAKDIAKNSIRDPILSKAMFLTQAGWENYTPTEELAPFFRRKSELSLLNGCLLWGLRVVVPSNLQDTILSELHKDHVGIVKMKMIARSYFWWPNLDQSIEKVAKTCLECAQMANAPPKAPTHPWLWPTRPWSRVHLDFAGPFMGHNFLIAVDAHSKWPEVAIMNSTTSEKTMAILQTLWARYGLPEQLVTDNGTQFTSRDFDAFCKQSGIKHTFSPPPLPPLNKRASRKICPNLQENT